MKKTASIILILCVLLTAVPAAAAQSFTDVKDDYWGKSYIDDMTARGLFTGYSDGTFRPDANITQLESLVLLSRLCTITDAVKDKVLSDHVDFLNGILAGKGMNWAYPNLAICIETGIVTREELEDFASENTLKNPVKKEVLSVFIVRAMQLEDEALALKDYKLNFDDTMFITYARRPYVYVLNTNGIVLGDSLNNFNPKSSVTRAVTATMLSRTIEYMEDNKIVIKIDKYSVYHTYGILAGVGDGSIVIKDYDGTARRMTLASSVPVYVDGGEKPLSDSQKGKVIDFTWSDEDKSLRSLSIDSAVSAVQGAIKSVDIETGVGKVYIVNRAAATMTGYTFGASPAYYYEDAKATRTDLKIGNFITVLLKDNVVITAYSYLGTYETGVTLNTITFGDPIIITVTDKVGVKSEIELDPDALPTVKKGGSASSIDKLRSGDTLTLVYKDSIISQINAELQTASVTGKVTRIAKDLSGNIITVKNDAGTEITYTLASDVVIKRNNAAITLDNINIGSTVSLAVSDEYVTLITVTETTADANFISGEILFINNTSKTILLQVTNDAGKTSNTTVQVDTGTKFMQAAKGTTKYFSDLKIYDKIDVYGAYNGDQFLATLIIIR